MRADWRVLIVEDDPVVAEVHRLLVHRAPGFVPVAIAGSAAAAAEQIRRVRPQLVLLDLGLPDHNGLAVLRQLRAANAPVEVIAITAAGKSAVVRAAIHLGVVEYLVKPFAPERLQFALAKVARRLRALDGAELDQTAVDALQPGSDQSRRMLPKGLVPDTLRDVRACVRGAGAPLAAEDVGAATRVSRVTARRYLEYLVTLREVDVEIAPAERGRPRKLYSARADVLL